ncbi:DNA repair exonuclease [Hazenella sp. IB182357]|uniref:DNA repair exonuclease n=1 Tax=Polycladospora coralii TaxID=2771432 RepID=A0A926N707_9BACL|nr:DNA repair exonuclease [Polycladospora coralii]MBD1371031.1 DNA repair exonuclease [Polycladospora coralii]
MKSLNFVHTADLHLDESIRGWRGTKEEAWQRMEEYRLTFQKIISYVEENQVPFLFIAGDFLEHGHVSHSTFEFVRDQFKRISNTNVLISPGNHDPLRSDSIYLLEKWPENVQICSTKWEKHGFQTYNLNVYGRGFSDFSEPNWIVPPRIENEGYNVLLLHGDYHKTYTGSSYFPFCEQNILNLSIDYVALGHIHKATQYQLNNLRNTVIRYPGSPEALNWKETGTRSISHIRIEGENVSVQEVPIQTRTYERYILNIQGIKTKEGLLNHILQSEAWELRNGYHLIELNGRRDLDLKLDRYSCHWLSAQLLKEGFHAAHFVDHTKPDFDLAYYRAQPGVIGMFVQKMEKEIRNQPEKSNFYEQALYRGLDALLSKEKIMA